MRKEKNRSGLYIAIFIAMIMILSVVGFIVSDQEKFSYGKYSFTQKNNQWTARISGKDLSFYYLPQDVESIEVEQQIRDAILNSKMVYITYSANETQLEDVATAQFSLGESLGQLNIFSASGLTEAQSGILQVTCSNATQFVPVIMIQKDSNNSITLNNNCIILRGNPLMAADRLKYAVYGVIK